MSGNWMWRSLLQVDLPMRMQNHDPANSKTLNVGRGGSTLDAAFGAGAAEPTKLTHLPGYSFDGADYMRIVNYPSHSADWSLLVTLVSTVTSTAVREYVLDVQTGRVIIGWNNGNSNFMFYDGLFRYTSNVYAKGDGCLHTAVLTNDGVGNYVFFIDGVANVALAGTHIAIGGNIAVGSIFSNDSSFFNGSVLHAGIANFALTPTQVLAYHRSQMKRINKI